jgi:hypothetical protein
MSYAYRLSGLKLASDFDLPGLMPWNGRVDASSDIVIRLGRTPVRLEAADHVAPVFQTQGGNRYLLLLPGTARMLVQEGCEVTVEPEPDADPTAIRAILAGPIQAVLWHQRGFLPLCGNAVVVDGGAVALVGPSAAGKSTLAARLSIKGHTPIADGLCVIDASEEGPVSVLPGIPHLQLWRDTLDHLGIATNGLTRILATKEKFLLEHGGGYLETPQPLASVVVLWRRASGTLGIERLRGLAAVAALHDNVYLRRAARTFGRDATIFAALTRLVAAGVTVWRLTLPDDLSCMDVAAAELLTVLRV